MGRAKEIIVKVIPAKIANEFVKKHHYSGKVVPNSTLHFGCFLDNKLHGVLSYGSPMVKKNIINIVKDTKWNEMLELNRMVFDDYLPKFSESRCIAITIKLIKKNAKQIKWIISFADGTQCGDGTIYRASGFVLTKINSNSPTRIMPNGDLISRMTITKGKHILKNGGKATWPKESVPLIGFQFRYLYLIDKSAVINVPILPFSKIDEMGAGMYKGKKITLQERRVTKSDAVDSNAIFDLDSQCVAITPTSQNKYKINN